MTHRVAAPSPTEALVAEMFETAQWAQASEAAASLAQMAARSAKGSPELAGLVRNRQDLVAEWQVKDKLLIAAKSEEPKKRKAEAEKGARRPPRCHRRAASPRSTGGSPQDFPDYAALASPAPVSVIGRAGAARLERGPGVVPRHARVAAPAGGELRLGRDQVRRALGAVGARHGGAQSRGGGAALRPRRRGVGRRGERAMHQGPWHPARQDAWHRRPAPLRPRPRPQTVHGPVRPGSRPHQRQAPTDRSLRPADAAPVPRARDPAAVVQRSPRRRLARPRARHHRSASRLLAQGPPPRRPAQHAPRGQ